GTANAGAAPTVSSFDTTGSGASNAAQFNVGQTPTGSGSQGGGIFQTVALTVGNYVFTADFASYSASANADCGTFSMELNGSSYFTYSSGSCLAGTTVRDHMTRQIYIFGGGGSLELRFLITRHYMAAVNSTPNQYID